MDGEETGRSLTAKPRAQLPSIDQAQIQLKSFSTFEFKNAASRVQRVFSAGTR
jgi:hypothetical protein